MKAEDTVMSGKQLEELIREYEVDAEKQSAPLIKWGYIPDREKHLVKAQAKISFEAGRRSGILDMEKQVADAYKGGIQEVVEFTEREFGVEWSKEDLKKWGIDAKSLR